VCSVYNAGPLGGSGRRRGVRKEKLAACETCAGMTAMKAGMTDMSAGKRMYSRQCVAYQDGTSDVLQAAGTTLAATVVMAADCAARCTLHTADKGQFAQMTDVCCTAAGAAGHTPWCWLYSVQLKDAAGCTAGSSPAAVLDSLWQAGCAELGPGVAPAGVTELYPPLLAHWWRAAGGSQQAPGLWRDQLQVRRGSTASHCLAAV
jgi:hypothetical protein